MIMVKKQAQIANFNVVFGEDESPMLDYFNSIIFPAMTSGIEKTSNDDKFMFMNIRTLKNHVGTYILTGILVKKTILEIKSDLNEHGELIEKDEKHSSAPYSSFAINLLNHRMIFMPNQKGSPSIATFRGTVRYVIETFIERENQQRDQGQKLPDAEINVVGIPSAHSLGELLDNVQKINSLTLRFYPLNGDIDFSEAFGILANDMRNEVGSKNGEIVFKSPKSIHGVKNILEKAAGTISPVLKVVTKNGSKATLKDFELSEKYEIAVDDSTDYQKEETQLIDKMSSIDALAFSNAKHDEIYKRNLDKIDSMN